MSGAKFYLCTHCGNLAELICDAGVPMICCGEAMQLLIPNIEPASHEKHIPVVRQENGSLWVTVGAVQHPMIPEHYIRWICVESKTGMMCKTLIPGQAPEATFCLGSERPLAVYAYCNIHGLWMTNV